jgi:hypothetical protein
MYSHFILKGIHIEGQQWFTNRKKAERGGGRSFDLVENHVKHIVSRYQKDQNVFVSTMIDLYTFPKQGNTIYDEEVEAAGSGRLKLTLLERKFAERINHYRFIPYVQLHEFEALLLSKPEALSLFYTDKEREIQQIKDDIGNTPPEEINETPEGAPSKRIIRHIPLYKRQKTTAGITAAKAIGLPFIREKCPHFDEWITQLENL